MLQRLIAPVLLIGFWAGISKLVPAWPSPSAVFGILWDNFQQEAFVAALGHSMRRMVIGYVCVVFIGISMGLLLGRLRWLDQLMGGLAVALYAIPGAAWVPLAILFFGMTERAVIFTILLGATGIVIVNTNTGIRDVPPIITRASRTMGAKGWNYFWFVIVPAAFPKMVDGLRLAWAFGWRALMAGELLTSIDGIGQLLNEVARSGQLDRLLALMLLIAAIGIGVDGLVFKRLQDTIRVRWGLA